MDLNIRQAMSQDAGAVTDLFIEVANYHAEERPDRFRAQQERASTLAFVSGQLEDPLVTIFVAEREGVIVGVAHVVVREERPIYVLVPRRFLMIDTLAVSQTQRRQGIGRALMAAVERWAHDQGLRDVELNVWEFNQQARTMYEQLGYSTLSRKMGKRLD